MKQYRELIERIVEEGESSEDRTGTGTIRLFGTKMTFDLAEGFPLVTLKYTHYPAIVHELLWFLSGKTNIKYLQVNKVNIWNEWATDQGDLGPVYGAQWRNANGTFREKIKEEWVWNGVDQLGNCIDLIKHNPFSRRIIVDCWNVKYLPDETIPPKENATLGLMALSPCHMMFQFFVSQDGRLDLQMYQRSVDSFLGLPFNIASYALLLAMVAQVTNTTPGVFTWVGGDTHIYNNHLDQVTEMLSRKEYPLPKLKLRPSIQKSINDYTYDDILLLNYKYHPAIKGIISV